MSESGRWPPRKPSDDSIVRKDPKLLTPEQKAFDRSASVGSSSPTKRPQDRTYPCILCGEKTPNLSLCEMCKLKGKVEDLESRIAAMERKNSET